MVRSADFALTGFRQTSTLFNLRDHDSKRWWVHNSSNSSSLSEHRRFVFPSFSLGMFLLCSTHLHCFHKMQNGESLRVALLRHHASCNKSFSFGFSLSPFSSSLLFWLSLTPLVFCLSFCHQVAPSVELTTSCFLPLFLPVFCFSPNPTLCFSLLSLIFLFFLFLSLSLSHSSTDVVRELRCA